MCPYGIGPSIAEGSHFAPAGLFFQTYSEALLQASDIKLSTVAIHAYEYLRLIYFGGNFLA